MKFTITDKYIFWWPVTVRVPSEEKPGTFDHQTFEMQFEALSKEDQKAFDERYAKLEEPDQIDAVMELIERVCRDWRDVVSTSGHDVEFHVGALQTAMQFDWFRLGVILAYREAMDGREAGRTKAQEKN